MLLRLIEDINNALDHGAFFSALALALTLPDICGKARYPDEKSSKKRYIGWYDEYVGAYEQYPGEEGQMPYLSGEVVYSLRCSFLHQGTPNIEKEKISEKNCKIDHFSLLIEEKNPFDIYGDEACLDQIQDYDGKTKTVTRSYQVSVRRLCMILTLCAQGYYKEAPDRFCFFDYEIVNHTEDSHL